MILSDLLEMLLPLLYTDMILIIMSLGSARHCSKVMGSSTIDINLVSTRGGVGHFAIFLKAPTLFLKLIIQ